MRLGLNLGYWGSGSGLDHVRLALAADELGYDAVWAAEAYGSDSATVLGYLAARTSRIALGSAVFQIPGRSPALTAMTAATLDTLSGGRFRLGLGVSGPQVSEGWHGVRFDKPLSRTREYIDVVRLALDRKVVAYEGTHYTLPLPDGPGKALRLTIAPVQERIPIYLAALGPKNLELAGEVADGWLGVFVSSAHVADTLEHLRTGRARRGLDLTDFDVVATVPVVVGDDVEHCADAVRSYAALYIGGMGSRAQNFYQALAIRMGYGEAAQQVQERFLARDYAGAAAAVPFEFVDATSLLGPPSRIVTRIQQFADAGVTSLALQPFAQEPAEQRDVLDVVSRTWREAAAS